MNLHPLHPTIQRLQGISLHELDGVALQNRIDSKYVLTSSQLEALMPIIMQHYQVLDIDGNRIFTYENNYFDTPDLRFYYDHHNGYTQRIKVRSRKYVETGASFFEIKKKEKVERTQKIRQPLTDILSRLDSARQELIDGFSRKNVKNLEVILSNTFQRITFVNNEFTERMTLDFNISFSNTTETKALTDYYVLEIKQPKSTNSPIVNALKSDGIRQRGFSKYIYGVMLLHPRIKKNNFLPLIKNLNKLNGNGRIDHNECL
ncbi:MAG: polyphosphate polymerase domain-containing protein [Flavobacterium stagni]